jgi:hypothetical protein
LRLAAISVMFGNAWNACRKAGDAMIVSQWTKLFHRPSTIGGGGNPKYTVCKGLHLVALEPKRLRVRYTCTSKAMHLELSWTLMSYDKQHGPCYQEPFQDSTCNMQHSGPKFKAIVAWWFESETRCLSMNDAWSFWYNMNCNDTMTMKWCASWQDKFHATTHNLFRLDAVKTCAHCMWHEWHKTFQSNRPASNDEAFHVNVMCPSPSFYMNPTGIKTNICWVPDDVAVHEVLLVEVPVEGTSGGHLNDGRQRWTSQWVPLFSSLLYGFMNKCWKKEPDFGFCCTVWSRCLD